MSDYFCPAHPDTKLIYMLRGGAGFCRVCGLYVQALGVEPPKPTKAAGKSVKAKKKVRSKTR